MSLHSNAKLFLCYSFGLGISWSMVNLAFNLFLAAQGRSNAAIAFYNVLSVVGTFTLALPLGALGERLGRQRVLLVGATTTPIALIIVMLSPPPLQFVGAYLLGAGESIYFSAGYPHMAENARPGDRFRLYTFSTSLYYFGLFVGYILSSVIISAAHIIAPATTRESTMRLVLMAAAVVALSSVVPLALTAQPLYRSQPPPAPSFGGSRLGAWDLAPIYFISGVGIGALVPFIPLFLSQRYALSTYVIGLYLAGSQLISALATTAFRRVAVRWTADERFVPPLLILQVACLPFTAITAYVALMPIVMVAMIGRGLLADAQEPFLNGLAIFQSDLRARSKVATLNQTGWLVGLMCGTALSGVLQERYGWPAAFSITVATTVIVAVVYVGKLRHEVERQQPV